jgi:hypothetical protein
MHANKANHEAMPVPIYIHFFGGYQVLNNCINVITPPATKDAIFGKTPVSLVRLRFIKK